MGYLTLLLVLPALDAAMIVAIPGDQTTLSRSAAISASAATLILAWWQVFQSFSINLSGHP